MGVCVCLWVCVLVSILMCIYTGLGVKFVSDQRRLSSLIDGIYKTHKPELNLVWCVDLRRLNMRSVVGKKDVFLSYAHINVAFAQRIKVIVPHPSVPSYYVLFFGEMYATRALSVCV